MTERDETDDLAASAGRPSAWEWLGAHKHAQLLPTPWLTDAELEDFVEVLLISERLLGSTTRHVQHVERWGVPGDKQDGIDFFGRFNDGTPAAWQVKQLEKLSRRDVRAAVKAATFDKADEFYLVFGGVATVQAREEILLHPRWTLLDRRTLTETLRLLPLQTQHSIIERYWGVQVRRQFLVAPGDAMILFEQFKATRQNPNALINDLGQLAGRDDDMERMAGALNRSGADSPQILVVSGPGGRGKTRLLIEALSAEAERAPNRVITCLAPMRVFDTAVMEELHQGAGIIVIDDAHNDPSALDPLLAFARNHPDVQIILATRPSGLRSIQGAIARASFGPHEQNLVSVGELNLTSARRLVNGLTADIKLNFGLRNYLAEQARHSPHVAVILTNLIRKRQISGSIAVNENLRRVVLARYQEVMIPSGFDGFDRDTVHRVIATYACVQPDSKQDKDTQARIADFCGLPAMQLARVTRQLIDRGVVVDHDNRLRVVPDVLADQIVEDVAVFEQFDTGFVSDLWLTFGPTHYERLALTLGELDWRIGQRGGPAIMAPVWEAIRQRLSSPYPSSLCRELDKIAPLASTQPAAVVAALEDLRKRLDLDDASGAPVLADPEDEDEQLHRRIWPDSRQTSRSDVRAKLPKLYGRAAANDPATLETAVDALLALASTDLRPSHAHPEHARRVLSDDLSNLASLPDLSYPGRIVARVVEHCETHSDEEAVAALSALKPLLAKEELETVQSSLYELSFQPHLISEIAMRPVRDQIRRLLLKEGTSARLTRAGAAVDLLREALRAPHGYFGNTVGVDAVLAWEDDDLATMRTLADVAARTRFATIRRMVRGAVSWSAEHAASLLLQHAALSLQYELDRSDDIRDTLADLIIGSPWRVVGESVDRVPDLRELAIQRESRQRELEELTEEQRNEERQAQVRAKVDSRLSRVSTLNEALARRLLESGDAPDIVSLLGDLSTEAHRLGRQPSFRGVWQSIGDIQPTLLPEVVLAIASAVDDHPLDQDLSVLITQWSLGAIDDTLAWASDAVVSGRIGVRVAIASFVAEIPWTQRQAAFSRIWLTGIGDPDERVATTFLGSGGWYLHSDPQEAASVLLAHEIPPHAAAGVLLGAWRYGDDSESTQQDRSAHSAMLSIAARAGLNDFIAQETITGAARAHPDLALDFLLDLSRQEEPLPDDINDLRTVFEEQPTALMGWLLGHLYEAPGNLGSVVTAALNDQLAPNQAQALTSRVTDLQPAELITLVQVLGSLRLWVPNNLNLAEACLDRAEATNVLDDIQPDLRRGLRLRSWSWTGNESAELNAARDACAAAADRSTSIHLRAQLVQAADWFQQTIDNLRIQERDDDW
ncbi:hypothetical protein [Agromyces ramosus]|uniref:Restriction endonuclease n=1 Tax=Agromyces ramosus TaxID=33879 RepID=A0ABU0RCI3_9MICO|nr:hypothetical protein [Agromyces ramosus]MDQ0895778.1 hypothetical protein [Agromyces ramosus]